MYLERKYNSLLKQIIRFYFFLKYLAAPHRLVLELFRFWLDPEELPPLYQLLMNPIVKWSLGNTDLCMKNNGWRKS